MAGLRDAAILAVASDALLRVSEVSALDVQDVDMEEQTVSIRRGRTDQEGKGAAQFLGEPTTEHIRTCLASAGASLVEMQLAGRWSSPAMPGRYAQGQAAE